MTDRSKRQAPTALRARRSFARVAVVALATVLVGALGTSAARADGEPDTGFSGDGKTVFDFAGLSAGATAVAKQGDRYVLGGFAEGGGVTSRFAVTRLRGNGDIDPAFGGGDGLVVTDFFGRSSRIDDLHVLGSGKILVAGSATMVSGDELMALARYMPDGRLDHSFGGDGKVVVGFGGDYSQAFAIVLLPDGKFVAVGAAGPDYDHRRIALARFLPNGNLDMAFGGGDGLATARPPGSVASEASSAAASGGKIVVGGITVAHGDLDFLVARFRSSGSLDPSFNGDGIARRDNKRFDIANAVVVQGSGKVVLGGSTFGVGQEPNVALVRWSGAGVFDTAFGVAETDFGGNDQIAGLAVDGLGRLVGAGFWGGSMGVFRFSAMGHQDLGFGSEGAVGIDFPAPEFPIAVGQALLTPGAKILVVGAARIDEDTFGFAAARLMA